METRKSGHRAMGELCDTQMKNTRKAVLVRYRKIIGGGMYVEQKETETGEKGGPAAKERRVRRVCVRLRCLYRLNAKIAISKHAKIRFGEFAHISYPSTSDSINVSTYKNENTDCKYLPFYFAAPLLPSIQRVYSLVRPTTFTLFNSSSSHSRSFDLLYSYRFHFSIHLCGEYCW